MLPAIEYLDFAARWYGRVRFDLGSSGVAAAPAEALGDPPPVNDLDARVRFREAVARRYRVDPSEVVPALGASGALFVAHATLLEPGQRLLVESPSYEPLWRGAEALGIAVDRFERRFETGFDIDPDAVVAALTPQTRLVAVSNPHNPSGIVLGDETLAVLAETLATRNVMLLVDEVYLELERPAATARGPNVITCSSATKCWGAGWARAGWLLVPRELAQPAARVERFVSGMAPPICWAFGEQALANADELTARARAEQEGKREKVDAFVVEWSEGYRWVPPPERALFGWLVDRDGRDQLPLIERGVVEHEVIAAPGRFFGDRSALRLSWTCRGDLLEEGLARLGRALVEGS